MTHVPACQAFTRTSSLTSAARQGCPCCRYTDPRRECRCTPRQIETYRRSISGPLLDRIDIHVEVPRVEYRKMTSGRPAEPSGAINYRALDRRLE